MPNLFPALDQLRCGAAFLIKPVKPVAQIISQRQHLLKRARQRRQVLKTVTTCAELSPAERIRIRADGVDAVTFHTIEPRRIWTSRDVATALEELERLAMTTTTHLERAGGIWFPDETIGVSFRLFSLRGIAPVAAVASYSAAAVSACLEYREDRVVLLLTMTRRAVVLALASDWVGSVKEHDGAWQ